MRRDLQGALHERPDFGHVLELVEGTHGRVDLARVVPEVLAVVALALKVDARRQPVLEGSQREGPADRDASAVIEPVEIDVRERRRVLETAGDAEDGQRRFAAPLELAPHRDSTLPLSDVLPGDPGDVDRRRGVGVPGHLGGGEGTGVVGPRVPTEVRRGRERPAVGQREMPARVEIAEIGVRVLPLAGVVEPRDGDEPAARADAKQRARLPLAPVVIQIAVERAEQDADLLTDRPRSGGVGPDADHAARRVPEQRRRRAAQDLDPIRGAQLQVGELTLAIGERLRDAVHQHLDPTHGEGRTGPKPADRDSLIEREVVAVRSVHPRHGDERLVQAPRGPGLADLGLLEEVDGLGDAVDRRVGPGNRDDRGRQGIHPQAVRGTGRGGRIPLLGPRRERPHATQRGEQCRHSPARHELRHPIESMAFRTGEGF